MPKILFVDFDETLMCKDKSVSQENRDAMEALIEAGNYIVYTTGRARYGATKVVASLGLPTKNCFLATFQGSVCYDLTTEEEVYSHSMEHEGAMALIDRLNAMGYQLHIFTNDRYFTYKECEAVEIFNRVTGERHVLISSTEDMKDAEIFKIMIVDYDNREPLVEIAEETLTWNLDFEQFFSGQWYYEYCGKGQNKGTCVKTMCELLGVDIADTVAVGDEENDVYMIREAGIGVAMKNARDEIKAEADCVTENDNNHSGVAEVIYKYVLTD